MFYITADATCDFPESLPKIHNFYRLPMPYSIGENNYLHGNKNNSLTLDKFYDEMRAGNNPLTSCITPYHAMQEWRKTLQVGYDILHISFSSGLSSSYRNGSLAIKELKIEYPKRKVIIVDSLSAGIGEALLVLKADDMRTKGLSIEEVAEKIEKLKYKNCHYFIVNDLHHLKRGGRISHLAAVIGTAIQIKPMLIVNETGQLITIEKAISRRMALKHLLNRITLKYKEDATDIVFISHADALDDAEFVKDYLINLYPNLKIYINRTGPILVSHTGMGILGIVFIGKDRKEIQ